MPMPPYKQKAYNRHNAAFVGLFKWSSSASYLKTPIKKLEPSLAVYTEIGQTTIFSIFFFSTNALQPKS